MIFGVKALKLFKSFIATVTQRAISIKAQWGLLHGIPEVELRDEGLRRRDEPSAPARPTTTKRKGGDDRTEVGLPVEDWERDDWPLGQYD
ncbi:hypothetical protein KIN20_004738 [Parelaphostrongylus tenuis]|uniref:Uncharacterized protein n=1 Tax=Parelaphostrongylus tenuis TaxID=148309 RepID=A0AAD5QEN4_PARTN|nr:hypothetical protein KIN20_004738 [Parelaphostrongylus tenuis]